MSPSSSAPLLRKKAEKAKCPSDFVFEWRLRVGRGDLSLDASSFSVGHAEGAEGVQIRPDLGGVLWIIRDWASTVSWDPTACGLVLISICKYLSVRRSDTFIGCSAAFRNWPSFGLGRPYSQMLMTCLNTPSTSLDIRRGLFVQSSELFEARVRQRSLHASQAFVLSEVSKNCSKVDVLEAFSRPVPLLLNSDISSDAPGLSCGLFCYFSVL